MTLLRKLIAENASEYRMAAILGVLLILNVTGSLSTVFGLNTAIIVAVVAGYKTFYNAISAMLERRISADLALCVAVIAAFSAGQYLAAAEAMFIVLVGETLESFAAGRTEAAIEQFISRLPRTARLLRDGVEKMVEASELRPDDHVLVLAGERITADGVITRGLSEVNESSITGEPLPRSKQIGDDVFSGTLNGNGLLEIRVKRAAGDSTLARVVQLVNEAKLQRAPVERLADRYAKYFLPALLLAGFLTYYNTHDYLRTVAVLIVACPCALILATPTAMVAAIGGLARRGILVRGGGVLQLASSIDTIVFDKTGTITAGHFEILKLIPLQGYSEDELLSFAACVETSSDHALARVIVAAAKERDLRVDPPESGRVIPGRGVECKAGERLIRAGSAAFIDSSQTAILEAEADHLGATAVYVAVDDQLAGAILCRDRLRPGIHEAVLELRAMGIGHQVMLTGDRRMPAEAIAREAGIAEIEAELLPEQKLDSIHKLGAQGRQVAMVGDGINDAPALAAAKIGIAVAGAADISAEAAGVVYLPHSLEQLPQLFEVSRRAMRTAWLNIFLFAGVVNILAVIACATGMIGPIGAALTHQLSSFCVMMNSLRLLRISKPIEWRVALDWVMAHRREFAVTAVVIGMLSGFYAIQPDELGVIERFGKKVQPFAGPGLHYKMPWPIDRLTRIQARRIRVVEIGFRSSVAGPEPTSYEWNVRHRLRPDEALTLTGDQNMIELTATVHYEIKQPDAFLFRQLDGEGTVRAAAQSVIHSISSTQPLEAILTTGRESIEAKAKEELQRRMDKYETGVRVVAVKLEDVHPSTEVVDAFRDVSAAFEEKNRLMNEADAYRNEQIALARGNAKAQIAGAAGYAVGRVNRSAGDAARFNQQSDAYLTAPGVTQTRLYLETMEQVLPAKRKLIMDTAGGRRHLLMLEDGVELAPLPTGKD